MLGLRRSSSNHDAAWNDRVARVSGNAYHEIAMEEYDEWQKNGFSAKRDDFMNRSEEEENRFSKLSIGCP